MNETRSQLRLHEELPRHFSLVQGEVLLRDTPASRQLEVRDALLLAFLVSLNSALQELGGAEGAEREILFAPEPLAAQLGLSLRQVELLSQWLRRAGVWEEVTGRERKVRFAEGVLEGSMLPLRLDWPRLLERVEGDAGALALALSYLSLMRGGGEEWYAISHADAGARMRAGRDAVRRARSVLIEAGLLEERTAPGQTSEVRWSAYARGLAAAPSAPATQIVAPEPTPSTPAPVAPAPLSPAPASSGRIPLPPGVPLEVQGRAITLPPGVQAELEVTEGRYYLWIGPLRLGPLDS